MQVAPEFRLDAARARETLAAVLDAVVEWRRVAAGYGLVSADQERMEPAFQRQLEPAAQAVAR